MRSQWGERNHEGTQGLQTHRLLSVLRLQHEIQEFHHGTNGRVKTKTFEAFRYLFEHDVELLLDLQSGHLARLRHPLQDPVPGASQKTINAFNAVIVPL